MMMMMPRSSSRRSVAWWGLVVLSLSCSQVAGVDHSKFRTCGDTRFCRVHRATAPDASPRPETYTVDASSVTLDADGRLVWTLVRSSIQHQGSVSPARLVGSVCQQTSPRTGVRVRIEDPTKPRWEPDDVLLPALPKSLQHKPPTLETSASSASLYLSDGSRVEVSYAPFVVSYFGLDGADQASAVLNGRGLLHFEGGASSSSSAASSQENDDITTSVAIDPATGDEEKTAPKQTSTEDCPAGEAWNGEKCLEIVGYWEDGLARFADGTKEVKTYKTDDTAHKINTDEVVDVSESFSGHRDAVPNGPTSVGVDVKFPRADAAFGLAEHATRFSLASTLGENQRYKDPYRFYNLDVFEYDLDEPMALYGAIPLTWAHSAKTGLTAGCFWNNPSETFVDVLKTTKKKPDEEVSPSGGGFVEVRWLSESGVIDVFLLATTREKPTPLSLLASFSSLVGAQELPPIFALGYHQCRWNYKDEKDVAAVHGQFEALDIPYDVLWLDIEHTDGKRYFTWDEHLFPDPISMQQNLSKTGRKMVTIVDPHIKRDSNYIVHTEATKLGLYIKDKSKDFEGWCWPGSSSYLDFTDAKVRDWWADRFSLDNYEGSTINLYTWNDMNEPSVFNGPEVTMHKEAKSIAGVEHREWHNLYGMYFHRATAEGLLRRGEKHALSLTKAPDDIDGTSLSGLRSFVLTRSFFAGSQRWGAVWTGDNAARWDHLQIAAPMLLSLSVCGFSFAGADAGGFFGDPEPELMARWIQAAAFTPFFRGHAHHDAKRREPWSFGDPWTARLRNAIADRYAHLPYWYTTFARARFAGEPVIRPLWAHFPRDSHALEMDDAWLVGPDLLIKPVVDKGAEAVDVYFPSDDENGPGTPTLKWLDARDHHRDGLPAEKAHAMYDAGRTYQGIPATLDMPVPVFQRAGSIVPRQRRLRRSTEAMRRDPYELTAVVDHATGAATGLVYLDDQQTLAFADRRAFCWVKLDLTRTSDAESRLAATVFLGPDLPPDLDLTAADALLPPARPLGKTTPVFAVPENRLERLVVFGLDRPPTAATLHIVVGDRGEEQERPLDCLWDAATSKLVVRKPDVKLAQTGGWTIVFAF